jgi:hypothetical protein
MTLELRKTTKHSEHEPTVWGIAQGFERCASFADCIERVEQVLGRARKAIQLADHQAIALS